MNAYKEAWLAEAMMTYSQKRSVGKAATSAGKKKKSITPGKAMDIAAKQKAQGIILKGAQQAAKYAARSQVKGSVGIALRLGGRIGLRAVPVVGAAMLAYDLYQLGQYLLD